MARDATICTISEGTSEIQRLVNARTISGVHVRWSGARAGTSPSIGGRRDG